MSLQIRPLRRDDRNEVTAWLEMATRSTRVRRPDFEPRGVEATMAALSAPEPGFERHTLVGVVDDSIVITGEWWLFSGSEVDKALVIVSTDPQWRGRGHGRAMADAVERSIDRPTLLAEVDFTNDLASEHDGRFALARGYKVATTMTARRLAWPPDPSRLTALERPTPGYRLRTWVNGVPVEYRESFGILAGLVDADAPSGDVEWAGDPMTPHEYEVALQRDLAMGTRRLETLAFDEVSGEVVAFTSVWIPSNPARAMDVGSTYVRRDHRGHRLGLAMKIAMEKELLALDLPHPALTTGNDDANRWMIAVNETLGFVPFVRSAEVIKVR